MNENNIDKTQMGGRTKSKLILLSTLLIISLIIIGTSYSYAYLKTEIDTGKKVNVIVGTLEYEIESGNLNNGVITIPGNSYKNIIINIKSLNPIDSKYELYYNILTELTSEEIDNIEIGHFEDVNVNGIINKNSTIKTSVKIKNNLDKSITIKFGVQGGLPKAEFVLSDGNKINQLEYTNYIESILNGSDPVLSNNLIPVTIDNGGTVYKADTTEEWYSYEKKNWANVVILKDESITYNNGEVIPESNIESYFVWIPRYKYQIFNEGNYSDTITVDSKPDVSMAQEINIVFENKDTIPSTGSTAESYLTHPAFVTFDVNGLWVAKFQTTGSTNDMTVLPNEESLRNLNVKTMFELAYNYNRILDSHMMKNTEWGAVSYLSYSKYGRCINGKCDEIRINNSGTYITGCAATTPALNYIGKEQTDHSEGYYAGCENEYNTDIGYLASTTGNITGIYDMSGGLVEYMSAYIGEVYGKSGFDATSISLYDSKYFDIYSSSSTINSYSNRILGDATGELGPFYTYPDSDNDVRYRSYWYADYAEFVSLSNPWVHRGGNFNGGVISGIFAFDESHGGAHRYYSFRLVMAP